MTNFPLTWMADALRAAGIPVIEEPGWQIRGAVSQTTGRTFTPQGQLIHHSADAARTGAGDIADDAPLVNLIIHGRADLPGPLYNIHIDRDGDVHIIAAGRSNHAGRGSMPGIPTNSGNQNLVGINLENDGIGEPYSTGQIELGVRVSAVIAAKLYHGADMIRMHKEYSSEGKIDPTGIEGPQWRGAVGVILSSPSQPSTPLLSEEDDMHPFEIMFHKKNGGFYLVQGVDVWHITAPAHLTTLQNRAKVETAFAASQNRQPRWFDHGATPNDAHIDALMSGLSIKKDN